jgi:sulfate adenylyltransferase subunit 1
MVTAASTANLAVILVDARKGVLTQTRRHTYLASLVGIPHIVLAVNKMDMVDYSEVRYGEICAEYLKFAAQLGLRDVTCIPLSALTGEMLVERGGNLNWYQGTTLMELLENIVIDYDMNTTDFRYPVQWVCRPQTLQHHDFRGFMGRIEAGEIAVNDEITVLPGGHTTRVKEIVTYEGSLQRAYAPQSITITLADEIDVSRGDMFVKAETMPTVAREFKAMLCWLSETALDKNRKYIIKHATRMVKCVFTHLDFRVDVNTLERHQTAALNMNDIAHVTIKTQQPLVFDAYARNRASGSFIVIDEASNNTVAAGMMV